jgi:hypothetical protein
MLVITATKARSVAGVHCRGLKLVYSGMAKGMKEMMIQGKGMDEVRLVMHLFRPATSRVTGSA